MAPTTAQIKRAAKAPAVLKPVEPDTVEEPDVDYEEEEEEIVDDREATPGEEGDEPYEDDEAEDDEAEHEEGDEAEHVEGEEEEKDRVATQSNDSSAVDRFTFTPDIVPSEIRDDRRAVTVFLHDQLLKDMKALFEEAVQTAIQLGTAEHHLAHFKDIKTAGAASIKKTDLTSKVSEIKRHKRELEKHFGTMLQNAKILFAGKERRRGAIRGTYKTLGDFPKENKGNTSSHFTKAQFFSKDLINFLKSKKYGLDFEDKIEAMLSKNVLSIAVCAQLFSAYARANGLLVANMDQADPNLKGKYMRLTARDREQLGPILDSIGESRDKEYIEYSLINKIAGNAIIKASNLSEAQLRALQKSAPLVQEVHAAFAQMKIEQKEAENKKREQEKAIKDAERAALKKKKEEEKAALKKAKAAERAAKDAGENSAASADTASSSKRAAGTKRDAKEQ